MVVKARQKNRMVKVKLSPHHWLAISNGIAVIEDGTEGVKHSIYPSIDGSGSIKGMKSLGYWGKDDVIISAHGRKYNVSKPIPPENEWEEIAKNNSIYGKT